MAKEPKVYISTWHSQTQTGNPRVWQVVERGSPICAEILDSEDGEYRAKVLVYGARRSRGATCHHGELHFDIPEEPPVFDGDTGQFR